MGSLCGICGELLVGSPELPPGTALVCESHLAALASSERPGSSWSLASLERVHWRASRLNDKTLDRDERTRAEPAEANLVSSLLPDGRHAPALDIDFPAALVPSSSPGHFHLFLDAPMSWRDYRRLLRALYLGGVIGRNAYWRSLDRGASFVRPPGQYKSAPELELVVSGRTSDKSAASAALTRVRRRVLLRRLGWAFSERRRHR